MLCHLDQPQHPRLLVGIETSDDAGVYLLDEKTALIQTLDFFTPIVDDPYTFGQIAAANSLSDVYAMGGKPLTAMNIVAFPAALLDQDILPQILKGGQDKVAEAGAVILGGHTIDDPEPKYGLSVTGNVHPDKNFAKHWRQTGGCTAVNQTFGHRGAGDSFAGRDVSCWLASSYSQHDGLNRVAAECLELFTVTACTDITGFGLLGHLHEMSIGSGVSICIEHSAIPLLPEAVEAASMGLVPAGAYANRDHFSSKGITIGAGVPEAIADILWDPQTSGGLLVSVPALQANSLLHALRQAKIAAACIGQVSGRGKGEITVE